jgi:hypothetical protein
MTNQSVTTANDHRTRGSGESGVSSRRSILNMLVKSSAVIAGGVAAPVTPQASTEPDPIFAVIERHREAYLARMRASRAVFGLRHTDPAFDKADAADSDAHLIESKALDALCTIEPTTFVGVLALMQYVQDFYEQKLELPEESHNWHSVGTELEGLYEAEGMFDKFNGKPLELPISYWIMVNVRGALQELVARP